MTQFKTWKAIKIGTHKSNAKLRQALTDGGFRVSDWGGDILKKTPVVKEPSSVNLVVVSVADLGFPQGAKGSEIYDKALSLGLQLCPAEVGPQLRLQYPDQAAGGWILVAMEPIVGFGDAPHVFSVSHVLGDRWLGAYAGFPGRFWDSSNRWVFMQSKSYPNALTTPERAHEKIHGTGLEWTVTCIECGNDVIFEEINRHSSFGSDMDQITILPYCENKECNLYGLFQIGRKSTHKEER